ncbi:MAG TPA: hypothetical protein VF665_10620 [Longimicrobium sp.]|jgi:hypothetical protein|uniref:hypothetical protein n=1 Tax=Longimicrobium sp. TaxID=2029185 RepID=UPI002ED8F3B6
MVAGHSIRIAVSTMLLGLAACAPAAENGGPAEGPAPEQIVVRVANNGWQDVTVYVVDGTMRRRLGTVSGMSTGSFSMRSTLLSSSRPLQLVADPVGGLTPFVSQPLRASPGQAVAMRVDARLALSTVSVFDR